MATRTSSSRKAAPTTAAATEKTPPVFYSVGALFDKENGDQDLVLEPDFLTALGFEVKEGRRYSLHKRHKTGKSGKPYASIFICEADED